MTYGECCERLRKQEKIMTSDIPAIWFFYLLQDREIKNIQLDSKLYEINFISRDTSIGTLVLVNDQNCTQWHDLHRFITNIIHNIESGNRVTLCLDDEYFEIILELLESE